MSAVRNWLTCLVKGHRYDLTEIALQRLTYCECCDRELFKRSKQFSSPSQPSRISTLGQLSLSGGEGQAKEGMEAGENESERVSAAAAVAREAEANVIEAINCGRLAATTSHAIARPRKSLDAQPVLRVAATSGFTKELKVDVMDCWHWARSGGGEVKS